MAQRSVLAVDDDPNLLQTLLLVLGPVCDVRATSNASEAVRIVKRERPSLVLLDVSMPEMGGLGLLRALRRLDPSLAVVMLSGQEDLRVVKRALDDGARAYITKPFDAGILRAEVRRLLPDPTAAPDALYRPWRVSSCVL